MKNVFKNWSFMRLLRLILGVYILVQGLIAMEWIFILTGLFFSIMPIFNIGCCTTYSCTVPISENKNVEKVSFKEIK
jgi:hypothetical protein